MRSKSDIRRLIKAGAIDICGSVYKSPNMTITIPVRVGKKEFVKLGVEIDDKDLIDNLSNDEQRES